MSCAWKTTTVCSNGSGGRHERHAIRAGCDPYVSLCWDWILGRLDSTFMEKGSPMKHLRDCAEIRNGNMLIIYCQGMKPDGSQHCDGRIRVPFLPPLSGCLPYAITDKDHPGHWHRVSGETLDDLTLIPSIDAGECGHFHITKGQVTP